MITAPIVMWAQGGEEMKAAFSAVALLLLSGAARAESADDLVRKYIECGSSRKVLDPMDEEPGARRHKWQSASQKLQEKLGSLGLVMERDYRLHGEEWPYGIGVEIRDEILMTADVLIACSSALLESEDDAFEALVAIHDSTRINKMRTIVQIRCGGYAAITGGEVTTKMIFEAYHKLGIDIMSPPKNLMSPPKN